MQVITALAARMFCLTLAKADFEKAIQLNAQLTEAKDELAKLTP